MEECVCEIILGNVVDVDQVVQVVCCVFLVWVVILLLECVVLFGCVYVLLVECIELFVQVLMLEMGVFIIYVCIVYVLLVVEYLCVVCDNLVDYFFICLCGIIVIVCELIGVCVFIMFWNWLIYQIIVKVGLVLVVGCIVVLKLSELLLLLVLLFVEIVYEVGILVGVFNLVNGSGFEVGVVMFLYLQVDMILIIGFICVGVLVV